MPMFFAYEIVGVTVKSRKSEETVEADEAIRPDTTVETLAKLPAIGGDDATHTAGNAPGVNYWGRRCRSSPQTSGRSQTAAKAIARVLAYGTVADDFPDPAKTPAGAAKQALEKIGQVAQRRRPLGRSTRPSPRSRSTRYGCSTSRRTRSTSTAAQSLSGTRSGASGSSHRRRAGARAAPPRWREKALATDCTVLLGSIATSCSRRMLLFG